MDNTCVCCGEMIPEGRQVCYICEKAAEENKELTRFDHCDKAAESDHS